MADLLETRIIAIIQDTLRASSADPELVVTADDSMDTVAAWDSLSFMSVFMAVNEAFQVDPDFDDAIHYTSVKGLHAYLLEQGS